jgi:phenylpropionate dioxygenase-like ring-hydroxylating dioxygenase large terminal subunit
MTPAKSSPQFTGYGETQVPMEDAELTHVMPGTPGGEYLRRFWHPVALETEVSDIPLLVRVLGEELVLFRDLSGAYGLLHRHCAHRQASLEYGKCEAGGLRCCYHGWLFAVDGTLLEAPAEAHDSPLFSKVRQPAYPLKVCNGLLFAYLGPPQCQPEFPVYDTFALADMTRVPYVSEYPCNWLQIIENAMDPVHSVFLHSRVNGPSFSAAWGQMSVKEFYEDDLGFYYSNGRRVDEHIWVRMHHVIVPNMAQAGAVLSMTGEQPRYFGRPVFTRWVVPVDNENTRVIAWANFGPRSDAARADWMTPESIEIIEGAEPRTRSLDAALRRPGDYEAFVSMGKITRHAREHLATSDKGVAMFRRRLRKDIRSVQENGSPPLPNSEQAPFPTYAGDTVLRIPPKAGHDDEQLVASVCRRVVEIFRSADLVKGLSRDEQVMSDLRALERDASGAS